MTKEVQLYLAVGLIIFTIVSGKYIQSLYLSSVIKAEIFILKKIKVECNVGN